MRRILFAITGDVSRMSTSATVSTTVGTELTKLTVVSGFVHVDFVSFVAGC